MSWNISEENKKMMQLKKNQPVFEVVEGPFKGRTYRHVVDYHEDDIPPADKAKFIAVKKAPELIPTAKKAVKEQQPQAEKTA